VRCAGTPRPQAGRASAAGQGRLTTAIQSYLQRNDLM
jgi:hypothetical protein